MDIFDEISSEYWVSSFNNMTFWNMKLNNVYSNILGIFRNWIFGLFQLLMMNLFSLKASRSTARINKKPTNHKHLQPIRVFCWAVQYTCTTPSCTVHLYCYYTTVTRHTRVYTTISLSLSLSLSTHLPVYTLCNKNQGWQDFSCVFQSLGVKPIQRIIFSMKSRTLSNIKKSLSIKMLPSPKENKVVNPVTRWLMKINTAFKKVVVGVWSCW